jgi:DNA-binding response OmpR family regulator
MRALVVEDHKSLNDIVCEILRHSGIEVTSVRNYKSAIMLIGIEKWDVLLSDMLFAGWRTGLDLASAARPQGIRCIIMSGALERRRDVEAQGMRFLAKPFSMADLLAALILEADASPTPAPDRVRGWPLRGWPLRG